jgi:AraC-like DNA-binding protein
VDWPDQSHFARRFKARYGLSPTSYRKNFSTRDLGIPQAALMIGGASGHPVPLGL